MRSGDLGALVFGAAAPFVLHSLLRLTGWMRPPAWNRGRAVARVALGSAVSAAFVPGSLILYALCAAILAVGNAFLSGPTHMLRRFSSCIVGLALGWILLLPWSASWWGSQGVFGKLFGHGSNVYAANFHGHNMGSVLLGQTPRGPALLGVAMPLFALAAILVGERQRRKTAIALLAVIVTVGLVVAAIAAGIVPPFIATPDQAGVLAAVAFAGLVGLGVAAFRLDLPRRGLGTIHAVTIGLLAAGAFLIAAGSVPAIWHGDWMPGKGTGKATSESIAQVDSVISADIPQFGAFRALWVGPEWSAPNVDPARSDSGVLVTGPRGQEMTDLFDTSTSRSRSFQRAIESIESGATDRAGGLLGAFNIRYVVVARTSGAYRWLGQRDLGLVRTEHKYLLLENQNVLARAAVYNHLPPYVQVIAHDDPSLASDASNVQRGRAAQRAAWSYRLNSANGPGVVFLAESFDPGWRAKLQGASLGRIDGGWGNAFVIPKGLKGTLDISFPRTIFDVLWLLMIALAWVVVLGASFSKRREPRPAGVPT
jgi:hypothetical protein